MARALPSVLAILLLWAAGVGAAGQFAKIAVPFPEVQMLYPEAAGRQGWLLSSISLVGALLGIVAGRLVGRLGTARVLYAGLLGGAAISLWQATGLAFPTLLASRLLEGGAHLAIVVAAPTLMLQIAPARLQGAAMALWSTFFGVSFALAAWLGLPLVAAFGPRALFLAHGLLMLAIALLLATVLRRARLDGRGAEEPARPGPALLAAHLRAYRSPFIAAPGIGWLFYTMTFVALLAILPERLPEGQRQSLTALLPLLGIAVSLLVAPLLLRIMGGTTIVVAGFALAAAAIASLAFGASLTLVCLALFPVLGLVQSGSFAAVPELNGNLADRALSHGVMAQTGNIGNLLGTPALQAVLRGGGEAGLFTAVVGLYGAGIAAHLFLRRQRIRTGRLTPRPDTRPGPDSPG
ncbi:MAG: MFS transporter [Pseudomonadota bacterium]